jgi:hypothetical protein
VVEDRRPGSGEERREGHCRAQENLTDSNPNDAAMQLWRRFS